MHLQATFVQNKKCQADLDEQTPLMEKEITNSLQIFNVSIVGFTRLRMRASHASWQRVR